MKKYKYYPINSISKEAVGVVKAHDEEEAYKIASIVKKLTLKKFQELFTIERFDNGE